MTPDVNAIGSQKVKSIPGGESVEMRSFWQDQNVAIFFFRRWGCMFCRLWAKELSEIAPVLKKNNIKLVGIGVEDAGSKEFVDGKFFDGDLYYVEDRSTYQMLGFKRFNIVSLMTLVRICTMYAVIFFSDLYYVEDRSTYQMLGFKRFNIVSLMTSLFWKQSREAIAKGKSMGLGGDLKGDWVQTGGALFVEKGGKVLRHFSQTGPSDHLSNKDILKLFDLENEYKAETMANKKREELECNRRSLKPWRLILRECPLTPIHNIWAERRCKQSQV
ncbi:unnamed protein product [Euphydryas editha]|uniref:Prostamide/prostaglandin F synthase n=1 Tax=Euphydryas editha TaxID=104508 RepID=A0AAU9UKT8_EUPED|nr:unnamed protein product [Euphydryas editha]